MLSTELTQEAVYNIGDTELFAFRLGEPTEMRNASPVTSSRAEGTDTECQKVVSQSLQGSQGRLETRAKRKESGVLIWKKGRSVG